jgi:hypothetical protein
MSRFKQPNWSGGPGAVQTPSSPVVRPVRIVSTSGDVKDPEALTHPGAGRDATLTATAQTISPSPVRLAFPSASARYLKLNVTKLGLPPAGDGAGVYVQLAELQVFGADPDKDLAAEGPVSASGTIEAAGWGAKYLTDGVTDTQNESAHGWASTPSSSADVSGSPVWVTVDLGTVRAVSSVVLWPRTDTLSPDGRTASFPVDYSIQTSATDTQPTSFAVQKSVGGQTDPPVPVVKGGASIILDYGHEVGGYPSFDVSAASGSPRLQAGYSETRTQIGPKGDGVAPWASGDPQRYDTYQVDGPGRITNSEIQGGERYQEISLTTPGTVALSAVTIQYTPYRPRPDRDSGSFISSSDQLNRYWYDGAYTAEVNQVPVGTTGPRWNTDQKSLDVPGTSNGTGLLKAGKTWTDYTVTFQTKITTNQAGWAVRRSRDNGDDLPDLARSAASSRPRLDPGPGAHAARPRRRGLEPQPHLGTVRDARQGADRNVRHHRGSHLRAFNRHRGQRAQGLEPRARDRLRAPERRLHRPDGRSRNLQRHHGPRPDLTPRQRHRLQGFTHRAARELLHQSLRALALLRHECREVDERLRSGARGRIASELPAMASWPSRTPPRGSRRAPALSRRCSYRSGRAETDMVSGATRRDLGDYRHPTGTGPVPVVLWSSLGRRGDGVVDEGGGDGGGGGEAVAVQDSGAG